MKRKLLFLSCLFIATVFGAKAQNLIPNGDFSKGKGDWEFKSFTLNSSDSNNPYVETGVLGEYDYSVFVRLRNKDFAIEENKTYILSCWASKDLKINESNHYKDDINASIKFKDASGSGVGYTHTLYFTKKETSGEWAKFEVEFTTDATVAKVGDLKVQLNKRTPDNRSNKKLKDISIREKKSAVVKVPAPTNLKAEDEATFQRAVVISWDKVAGATAYSVQVGGTRTPVVVNEKFYEIEDLEPGTTYEVKVKSTQANAEEASLNITTKSFTESVEADRIPYLSSIKDNGKISKYGVSYFYIYDTAEKPTITEVSVDGTPLAAPYTLTPGHIDVLKIKVSVSNDTWELVYKNIEVEN